MRTRLPALAALPVLGALLAPCAPAAAADAPLRFHSPDSGAPPWIYLTPGGSAPEGVVAEILARAAQAAGRTLRYEFQPRESASASLRSGSADGALFFSVTRPPARELVLTEPLATLDSVLVTTQERPLEFRRPSDLRDQRLCTLTEEIYPPLALLSMNGQLLERRAKTEQAALMMLRNESCVAAVLSGPQFRWMRDRYGWEDLRSAPRPLLNEDLLLGFAPRERDFARQVDRTVRTLRESGELDRMLARWLPKGQRLGMRAAAWTWPRQGVR